MSALDAHRTLHQFEGASPSPSGFRASHSRQMSSLSMTTFTTSQSHYPSEPLLRNADHREAHTRLPPHPDTSTEDRRYWEEVSARRMRRLRLLKGALWSIIGSWASYTTVRYFIAYAVYSESSVRQSVALSLGISSLLSLLVAAALALSLVVPRYSTLSRPLSRSLGKSLRHVSQFLASFFLFVPAAVNLALVFSWRNNGSDLSLRGRCHWGLDVVWVGVGGQCIPHAPAWGVWLAAAVSRFVLTAAILITYHLVSRTYRASRWLHYCATDGQRRDTVDITPMEPGDTPSRPSPVLQPFIQKSGRLSNVPQRSLSSGQMAVIPEFNEVRNQIPIHYEHEYAGLDSVDSSTLSEDDSLPRSVESSSSPSRSLRHTKSSRGLHAGDGRSRQAALVSNVGEGEHVGFADRFRALVDRVSLELEEARNLESEPPPRTPPLHHVLDTHTPYMSIDEFGREVYTEEPVAMFGGVIRRMPTIESVGSRELASLRSTMLVSACGGVAGPPSIAPSSSAASSRPPTRATMVSFNDAASASLASVSAQSSRSNSIHRPRMPSELGEIVRDALRARGQPRASSHPVPGSTSTRPGSAGSGGIETVSAPPRSRSNSQGANEVLAPVTEHGEHPDGAPRSWAPRRLCDTPEQLLAAGASELGELVIARPGTARSRSLGSSSPSRSATSTTYFTAGTGSSGDTGTSSGGGAPRREHGADT
ncbi:hypothetical protein H4582DRAFT_624421 [Lactarius indigo]|nr:hypothetical protein H4582DRAFT_624421 [Lactarius indigo]